MHKNSKNTTLSGSVVKTKFDSELILKYDLNLTFSVKVTGLFNQLKTGDP